MIFRPYSLSYSQPVGPVGRSKWSMVIANWKTRSNFRVNMRRKLGGYLRNSGTVFVKGRAMTSQPNTPTDDDAIVAFLSEGKRTQALLLLFRHQGGTLDDAWRTINTLDDRASYENPDHDAAYRRVTRYLAGSSRRRTKLLFYTGAFIVLAIGCGLVGRAWPRFKTGWDSYSWAPCQAVILGIRQHHESHRRQQRVETHRYLTYRYEYTVDGVTHHQTVQKRPFYPSLGEHAYEIHEVIDIVYNPDDPSESVHFRLMYQRSLWVVVGMMIALVGFAFVAGFASMHWNDYQLRRSDPSAK